MTHQILLTTTTLFLRPSLNRSLLWRGFLFAAVALTCFDSSPRLRAVSPPPDGGYSGSNTAEGTDALFNLTTGYGNTATGFDALYSNTSGGSNTATGLGALFYNTTGSLNTATGYFALFSNTTGGNNTATGYDAFLNNTTGNNNTATGFQALYSNTTAYYNTADGVQTLYSNTTGNYNTANGFQALYSNTTAYDNTASGFHALSSNTTGGDNTAVGFAALSGNTSGSSNIALGTGAGGSLTTGSNNIDIGNRGQAGESGKIRIGKQGTQNATFIAGIYGKSVASATGVAVFVDSSGHLGTIKSSARFKEAIKPMDKASEAILALKPVTFRYKHELDPDGVPQFGLIAEQVEKVNPDLVVRDEDGKVDTVRYEAINAMLLNEFLKEHRTVQEQKASISHLKDVVSTEQATALRLQQQIETLTAAVRNVSEQIEVCKPAPQFVASGR